MESLFKIVLTTSGFCAIDKLIKKSTYFKRDNSRWYLMHFITNMYIVYHTFEDMVAIIINPAININLPINNPMFIVSALHLYHIISFYKKMTFDDWWHHVLNCFLVTLLTYYYKLGIMINYFLFYMCGLPGGIDYGLLTLNEIGAISRITEKRINKYLNMWIRLPGILYGCAVGWFALTVGNLGGLNPIVVLFIGILNFYNAIYFASLVTENAGYHKCMDQINIYKYPQKSIVTL